MYQSYNFTNNANNSLDNGLFITDENIIKGCQSKVWLHAEFEKDLVSFYADSEAIITKGIIALLIRVLNNQSPENILDAKLNFINEIGLTNHLSPTRANGLLEMVKQMKAYAYSLMIKNNLNDFIGIKQFNKSIKFSFKDLLRVLWDLWVL